MNDKSYYMCTNAKGLNPRLLNTIVLANPVEFTYALAMMNITWIKRECERDGGYFKYRFVPIDPEEAKLTIAMMALGGDCEL